MELKNPTNSTHFQRASERPSERVGKCDFQCPGGKMLKLGNGWQHHTGTAILISRAGPQLVWGVGEAANMIPWGNYASYALM